MFAGNTYWWVLRSAAWGKRRPGVCLHSPVFWSDATLPQPKPPLISTPGSLFSLFAPFSLVSLSRHDRSTSTRPTLLHFICQRGCKLSLFMNSPAVGTKPRGSTCRKRTGSGPRGARFKAISCIGPRPLLRVGGAAFQEIWRAHVCLRAHVNCMSVMFHEGKTRRRSCHGLRNLFWNPMRVWIACLRRLDFTSVCLWCFLHQGHKQGCFFPGTTHKIVHRNESMLAPYNSHYRHFNLLMLLKGRFWFLIRHFHSTHLHFPAWKWADNTKIWSYCKRPIQLVLSKYWKL